ncbi:hypothetical protein Daura_40495 [Dactylosporangium aurantiacum]|uniref:Uncharacterized protein n=1 Tax=Dactylosporangium aurantiacum TaxID=35754 RepID=A0A9Q9IUA6_9ACTN|nr:hypothetical protein [Dactylosporangium aurantiacum]MDG6102938.1 hypothetical protein [Dactylosporangium aurantiacum]UWZ60020.1 hypothetical protein Daura_40495 [Dactylosporangium aurantiacum]
MAWLAVRDRDPAPALGLTELGETDWRSGVDLAYFTDDRVIVTPPVDGWVLVLGMALMKDRPDVTGLSAALATEVQFFSSHRGLQVYRWQRARDGDLLRSFAAADGEIDELGERSDLERSFGELVDDGDVHRVAAQWSVDPGTLNVPVRVFTRRT